jgi:hypothetical protein
MKRYIKCFASPELLVGKFVIVKSDRLISGLDETCYVKKIRAYVKPNIYILSPDTRDMEGIDKHHLQLQNELGVTSEKVICGEVSPIKHNGKWIRELIYSNEDEITTEIGEYIEDLYGM